MTILGNNAGTRLVADELSVYLGQAILYDLQRYRPKGAVTLDEIAARYQREYFGDAGRAPFLKNIFTMKEVGKILSILEDEEAIVAYHDPFATSRYFISDRGEDTLAHLIKTSDTIAHKFEFLGEDWMIEALSNLKDNITGTPTNKGEGENAGTPVITEAKSSDRPENISWSPIPVDRADQKWVSAIDAIDKARNAIEENNGYNATEPDERNAIVSSLKTASEALKTQSQIYYFQFSSLIWEPLVKAGKRFENAATGLAIQAAKEALKEVFKDWIKGGMNS